MTLEFCSYLNSVVQKGSAVGAKKSLGLTSSTEHHVPGPCVLCCHQHTLSNAEDGILFFLYSLCLKGNIFPANID